MADDKGICDIHETIINWVHKHHGVPGLVLLAVVCSLVYAGMNWGLVKEWILARPILADIILPAPPLADRSRFSVMVAHLDHDTSSELERLIVEALKEFRGVQVLRLDRVISLEGTVPEEEEKRGHERARGYLSRSGASVLIWGTVLGPENPILGQTEKPIPKLYWTGSGEADQRWARYDAPKPEDQFRLPVVFWSDLSKVLGLIVAKGYAEFQAKDGHYVAGELHPFVERVRKLLKESEYREAWDAEARASTRVILAGALQVLGDQTGQNEPLEEAVAAYKEAFKDYTRERVPLQWAMTQNNLGNALCALGQRESGTDRLEEAVAAYKEALKEFIRERVPFWWAKTQNNLGTTLWRLGERETRTDRLEEAVTALGEALKEMPRERVPLQWAVTQNNLGAVLRTLGARESGTERLEEAVAAYKEALKEVTREHVPLQWAMTKNNLGNAVSSLGQRESGTDRLQEAVAAYKEALTEYTRERVPMQWAATQDTLGTALWWLGEREGGTKRLQDAVAAFNNALEVFRSAQASYYVEGTSRNLRLCEELLNTRKGTGKPK